MSITSVMKEVKTAIAGGSAMDREKLTQLEARRIIKEAKKNGVTAGEAKAVVDTYETPRMAHTMAVGEGPSYYLTEAATKSFNKFFAELKLPAGDNEDAARQTIEAVIANARPNLDDFALATKPNTKHFIPVHFYNGAAGGSFETAYVNAAKNQFFFSTQNASARLPEKFYGPFALSLDP